MTLLWSSCKDFAARVAALDTRWVCAVAESSGLPMLRTHVQLQVGNSLRQLIIITLCDVAVTDRQQSLAAHAAVRKE